jgi:hypothetical protein
MIGDNNITNITPNIQNNKSNPIVTNYDSSSYYNSKQGFNNGIPASEIPKGSEDLYILKSQIVPPVCPACPILPCNIDGEKGTCPPCPACARCPQPNFDCKKVPNYDTLSEEYIPVPVLNDFSQFGM